MLLSVVLKHHSCLSISACLSCTSASANPDPSDTETGKNQASSPLPALIYHGVGFDQPHTWRLTLSLSKKHKTGLSFEHFLNLFESLGYVFPLSDGYNDL